MGLLEGIFSELKCSELIASNVSLLRPFRCKSLYIRKASGSDCVICCFVGPADSKPGNPESRTGADEAARGSPPPRVGRPPGSSPPRCRGGQGPVCSADTVPGSRSWLRLKEAVASWPERGKRQASFLRVELGARESGGHSIDKTQNQTWHIWQDLPVKLVTLSLRPPGGKSLG